MKELSTNIIEIDGKEYSLFLNRKGIVAYEKYCQDEAKKIQEFQSKYKDVVNVANDIEGVEIKEDENPFENLEGLDDIEEDANVIKKMYIKLYWIMLYTNHQLSLKNVEELFEKAIEEYGIEQLYELGNQMIEEVNINPIKEDNTSTKKLEALKPKK